jgi:hypothetical protein
MTSTRQTGLSSILAIFLVTVLAVLATAGIQMFSGARDDASLDMQSQRARDAARAGLQIAFFNATTGGTCTNASIANLPGTLTSFTVSVNCTLASYTDGANPNIQLLRMQAVACNRPAAGAVACPNDLTTSADLYVEAAESGECILQGASKLCRYR